MQCFMSGTCGCDVMLGFAVCVCVCVLMSWGAEERLDKACVASRSTSFAVPLLTDAENMNYSLG